MAIPSPPAAFGAAGVRVAAALAVALLALSVPPCLARRGGPDLAGHTWVDSLEPGGGVTYAWEEISLTGTRITPLGDGDDVNLGFMFMTWPFEFYGANYNRIAVCTNGWVSFVDAVSWEPANHRLPNIAEPQGTIAFYWDDLNTAPTGGGDIYYQEFPDRIVIQWEAVPQFDEPGVPNTFEGIIYRDGRIAVQYRNMTGSLRGCTMGIERPDQTDGLTAYSSEALGVIPPRDYRVEFFPPPSIPNTLPCATAVPIACGGTATGDLTLRTPLQSRYDCTTNLYDSGEDLYVLDLAVPTTVRLSLETVSGDPEIIVLRAGCDPNACQLAGAGDSIVLTNAVGQVHVVVDALAGNAGAYDLHVDCLPVPTAVDCAGATPLTCFQGASGDLAVDGAANQSRYWCSTDDWDGREKAYRFDVPVASNVIVDFGIASGSPVAFLLTGCDAGACQPLVPGVNDLNLAAGTYFVVVESKPGDEGAYSLWMGCYGDEMAFCTYPFPVHTDPWGAGDGSWTVPGWMWSLDENHNWAVRVDGGATRYRHDFEVGDCPFFPEVAHGVVQPNGPAIVGWRAPEVEVIISMFETSTATCCGLLVQLDVRNTDVVEHFYEFRGFFDIAFANGNGTCTFGPIEGGPIDVGPTRYFNEVDLIAAGGNDCTGQVRMHTAEDLLTLVSSWEMLPPNLPTTMEWVSYRDEAGFRVGRFPCQQWNGFVTGQPTGGCPDDSSLLLIWRFPDGAALLQPGQRSSAAFRIGDRCTWACGQPCQAPVLGAARAPLDLSPCTLAISLDWDPATFPGGSSGVYHVYRSTVSHADALTLPPITGSGITTNTYVDDTTAPGVTYFYVVQAENTDQPGCGNGPLVRGATASINLAPASDLVDVAGPLTDVGAALRAVGKSASTATFAWPTAPVPGAGERYAARRSDGDPSSGIATIDFVPAGTTTWTDGNAPPTYSPAHVWYYRIHLADSCGNVSAD